MFVFTAGIISCVNLSIYAAEQVQEAKFLNEINVKLKLDGFPDNITLLKNFRPVSMHYNNAIYSNSHNDIISFFFNMNNNLTKIVVQIYNQKEVEVVPFIKLNDIRMTLFQIGEQIDYDGYNFIETQLSQTRPIFTFNENLIITNHQVQSLEQEISLNLKKKETFNKKVLSLIELPKHDLDSKLDYNEKQTGSSLIPTQKSMEEFKTGFFNKPTKNTCETRLHRQSLEQIAQISHNQRGKKITKCTAIFATIAGLFSFRPENKKRTKHNKM